MMHTTHYKKYVFLSAVLFVFLSVPFAQAATTDNLSGYAWSDNIGWISFNCTNTSSCATSNYGVNISTSGAFSGYAWSDNIGWISFNATDVAGCPSGSCSATLNTTTGAVTGWARALAGVGRTDGWDGWIQLSGVTFSSTAASGYSWGSDVVGWISWSGVQSATASCTAQTISNCSLPATASGSSAGSCSTGYSGSCNYTCTNGTWNKNSNSCALSPPTATLSASPATINQGKSSTLTWRSTNATTCTSYGGFSTSNRTSGTASVSPSATSNYQIYCTGIGTGGTANSNIATVTVLVPTVSITSSPERVVSGGSTTIAATVTNVNSCTVTKNGAPWQTFSGNPSGTVIKSYSDTNITTQNTYQITCTNIGSSVTATAKQIVNIVQKFQEF